LLSGFPVPGSKLFAVGSRATLRGGGGRYRAVSLPDSVFVCILLQRLHGAGDHYRIYLDAVHGHADDREDTVVGTLRAKNRVNSPR